MINTPGRHPSVHNFRHHFDYDHLPRHLRAISRRFHTLAQQLVDELPDDPELTEALRKLWESKNSAVLLAAASAKQQAERADG